MNWKNEDSAKYLLLKDAKFEHVFQIYDKDKGWDGPYIKTKDILSDKISCVYLNNNLIVKFESNTHIRILEYSFNIKTEMHWGKDEFFEKENDIN